MEHAKLFPPSSAKRWLACTASPLFIQQLESEGKLGAEEDSEYSKQGTAAHEVLATCLAPHCNTWGPTKAPQVTDLPTPEQFGGWAAGNGYVLTAEDIIAVRVAYNYVMARWDEAKKAKRPIETVEPKLFIEEKVWPGRALERPIQDDYFGTLDIGILAGGVLEVIDYKHGSGVLVSPGDPQLASYALGLLKEATPPEAQQIRLTVLQPRHHLWRPEAASVKLLPAQMLHFRAEVASATTAAVSGLGMFKPTEEGCRWCPAKGQCRAYAGSALAKVQAVFGVAPERPPEAPPPAGHNHPPQEAPAPVMQPQGPGGEPVSLDSLLSKDPGSLGIEQMVTLYDSAEFIRGFLSAVEKHLTKLALQGVPIPRHKLVKGNRKRTITDEAEFVTALAKATKRGKGKLKKSDYIEERVISPAQAEKLLKPLLTPGSWEKVSSFIKWEDGALALVPESDRRPAVARDAASIFGEAAPQPKEVPSFLKP